jgi:flagellar motor component MotA
MWSIHLHHISSKLSMMWCHCHPISEYIMICTTTLWSCLTGNEQLILTTIIRHLDHKNVLHDPQTKSDIIQTATSLARQLRSRGFAVELVVAGDLCKHLRKTLEAVESGNVEDQNLNEPLQIVLEDCLMEVVRGVCSDYSALLLN